MMTWRTWNESRTLYGKVPSLRGKPRPLTHPCSPTYRFGTCWPPPQSHLSACPCFRDQLDKPVGDLTQDMTALLVYI